VKVKDFISILESGSLGESDPVSLASQVGGGKLHLLMEEVPLLFLENLSEIFIQGEEGGGHSGLGNKLSAGQQSGLPPLSHHASQTTEPPCLPMSHHEI
jgi:hypothetical protein